MKAVRLKQVDLDYRNHLQAYLNFAVKAEKKAGKNRTKPVYTKFNRFYDYQFELEKVQKEGKEKKQSKFSSLSKFLKEGG